jgi:RNA polymerase sigma-70 factor (ECF subfamily)
VLHDSFGIGFDVVGDLIGRTPTAARQVASRARKRVREAVPDTDPDVSVQRRVVDAFLAASRSGDFDALLDVLDPDVVFRRHAITEVPAVVGAAAVAREALARGKRLAPFARPVFVNGSVGAVVETGGRTIAILGFTIANDRIIAIDLILNPTAPTPPAGD